MKKKLFRKYGNNNINQEVLEQYNKLKSDLKNIISNNGKSFKGSTETFIPSKEKFNEIKTNKDLIKDLQMKLKVENIATNITDYDYIKCIGMFICLLITIGLSWLVIFIIWAVSRLFFNIPLWPTFILSAGLSLYMDVSETASSGYPAIWKDNLQIFISFLPFANKYSFCKILRKLQRLEKKYEDIENIYSEYFNHIKKNKDTKDVDFIDGIYNEIVKTPEEITIAKQTSKINSDYAKIGQNQEKVLVRSLKWKNK